MTFDVLNPKTDFNGDGRSDIYWRNQLDGSNAIWLMNGSQVKSYSTDLPTASKDLGWADPKFGDFDGNGKTDFFWRNTKSGKNVVWLMNGTAIQEEIVLSTVGNNWDYKIVDFNGDGTSDLFWQDKVNGGAAGWIIDDGRVASTKFLGDVAPEWDAYIADFNGDRRTDLFWRNDKTGNNAVWEMSGLTVIDTISTGNRSLDWSPTIADLNNDGRSDVFWHSTSGNNQASLWSSASDSFVKTINLPKTLVDIGSSALDAKFETIQLNGQDAIFTYDPFLGTADIWAISGDTVITAGSSFNTSLVGYDFQFADFNGDQNSDLLLVDRVTGNIAISTSGSNSNSSLEFKLPPELGWKAITA
jgi:hypothetical protein